MQYLHVCSRIKLLKWYFIILLLIKEKKKNTIYITWVFFINRCVNISGNKFIPIIHENAKLKN